MVDYADVYAQLGLSETALACATGQIQLLSPSLLTPFPAAGFPPCLIPIWLRPDGLEYFGYWHHFFSPRSTPIVSCAAETGFRPVEVARNIDQFFAYECIVYLSNAGGITPTIRQFADAVGVDVERMDQISAEVGDEPAALSQIPPFVDDPPMELVSHDPARYRGDFPSVNMSRTGEALQGVCTLELTSDLHRELAAESEAPAWIRSGDLPTTFDALLSQGNLQGAWLALNSTGWSMSQAETALRALADRAGDRGVSVLAEAWLAEPRRLVEGY